MASWDRARRLAGLTWVLVGLAFELVWLGLRTVRPGSITLVIGAAILLLAAATALRRARTARVLGWVVASLLGLELLGAVADRFGAWGPPGASGVSWGSWAAFVAYAGRLLPPVGPWLVLVAAVAATAVEVGLGVLLIVGWRRSWIGTATAGLFVVYLVAMAPTVGVDAVALFALPVLVGGALLVPDRGLVLDRSRTAVAR